MTPFYVSGIKDGRRTPGAVPPHERGPTVATSSLLQQEGATRTTSILTLGHPLPAESGFDR
jgi:hypothetical protein